METELKPKTEELSHVTTAAKEKVQAAEARKTNAEAAATRVRQELISKQELLDRVRKAYDAACMQDDQKGSQRCRSEMDLLDSQIHGCDLRLQTAEAEVDKLRGEVAEARRALGELERQQQIETETRETDAAIAACETAYLDQKQAVEKFATLLEQLREGSFLVEENRRRRQKCFEVLLSRFRGYNWYPEPERPKS